MIEEWTDIEGYEGKYKLSNTGKVVSLNYNNTGKPKELKIKVNRYGYNEVTLSKNNIKKALKMYDYSEFILDYVEEDKLSDVRKEEYEQVKELNNEMKKMSQQTIERSKYYSRIDYYDSLQDN